MRTPASVAGHPIHPMLIVFPVGLLVFSLICDLLALFTPDPLIVYTVALYTMVGGFIGALVAAVPGFIDFLSISDEDVKKIAVVHMILNLVVVVLYGINIWLRVNGSELNGMPLLLSVIAVGLLGISGWLGGSMAYRHGVGVNVKKS